MFSFKTLALLAIIGSLAPAAHGASNSTAANSSASNSSAANSSATPSPAAPDATPSPASPAANSSATPSPSTTDASPSPAAPVATPSPADPVATPSPADPVATPSPASPAANSSATPSPAAPALVPATVPKAAATIATSCAKPSLACIGACLPAAPCSAALVANKTLTNPACDAYAVPCSIMLATAPPADIVQTCNVTKTDYKKTTCYTACGGGVTGMASCALNSVEAQNPACKAWPLTACNAAAPPSPVVPQKKINTDGASVIAAVGSASLLTLLAAAKLM